MKQYNAIINAPLNNNNLFETQDIQNIEYGDADYTFSLFDNNEFDDFDDFNDGIPSTDAKDIWNMCPDCDVRMQPMRTSYQCIQCGRDKQVFEQCVNYSTSIIDNYNTNNMCSVSIKIVGKDSYRYHKALLRTSSDYSKIQSNNTNRQLSRFNSQCDGGKLPIIILNEAAELYGQIQKHNVVRRGNGRKGALGACISFVCDKHDITKKPKEIAKFLNIEESYLSKGDKLLRRLHSEGKIDIPIYHNPQRAYLRQYFEALSVDTIYNHFAEELINRSSMMDMMGENNSRISTKCAGVMYVLKTQKKLNFTNHDIVKYCKISKSTFLRYYEYLVQNRRLLNVIFKKHGIPPLRQKKKK